jgi:hypothetical protein
MKFLAALLVLAGLTLLWTPHYMMLGYFALACALVIGGLASADR